MRFSSGFTRRVRFDRTYRGVYVMYAYIVSYLQSHTSSFNIHACIFALMANNKQNNSNNSNNHNKSNNCERRTMNVASRRGTVGGFSEIVSPLKSLPRRLLILCPFCFCFPPPSRCPLSTRLLSFCSALSQIPLQFTSSVSSGCSSTAAQQLLLHQFYFSIDNAFAFNRKQSPGQ